VLARVGQSLRDLIDDTKPKSEIFVLMAPLNTKSKPEAGKRAQKILSEN
jgi:hypothetical protein